MSDLPPVLRDILELVTQNDRARFERLLDAAGAAMTALAEMDLRPFEADNEGENAFEVWERLAPVASETQGAIHRFLKVLSDDFVEAESPPRSSLTDYATRVVVECSARLKVEVREFAEGMRKPENMGDRWRLLQYVGAFRGRMRSSIGEMIFAIARIFATVSKADVIPFYRQDTEIALELRRTVAELSRRVSSVDGLVQITEGDPELLHVRDRLLELIDGFADSTSYRHLRIQDRRLFHRARNDLSRAKTGVDVRAASAGISAFLQSITAVNDRETLVAHDRDVAQSAADCLRSAREAIRSGILRAQIETHAALRLLSRLEGKSPQIDEVLEEVQPEAISSTEPQQLGAKIERLENLLESIRNPA